MSADFGNIFNLFFIEIDSLNGILVLPGDFCISSAAENVDKGVD